MRLAVLTGVYVAVVCSAQIGAQKIVEVPWTDLSAQGGAYLTGVALALIELAHHTAPTRRQGWLNAQVMIACGFLASGILAASIAIVDAFQPADATFGALADTWRVVVASLAALAISETVDNVLGAWTRESLPDWIRVLGTNAVSAPLDSVLFLGIAYGSLELLDGVVVAKLAATVLVGLPLVVLIRNLPRLVGAATRPA